MAKSASIKAAKKNCGEKIIPIPPEFYASNKVEDLIIPRSQAVPMAIVLQLMQWGAFVAFFTYYSLPPSFIIQTTIQSEWDYGGANWNCTPMVADGFYGVRWNYETCRTLLQPPNTETVVAVNDVGFPFAESGDHGGPGGDDIPTSGDAWRYKPFTGTGAEIKAVAGMANWFMEQVTLTDDERDSAQQGVYEQLKSLNSCGVDGFPRWGWDSQDERFYSDDFFFDIFQTNLKDDNAPPPSPPPPFPPPPPSPAPPPVPTEDAGVSVCCGGGSAYEVDEPECQAGTFDVGGVWTTCSNFQLSEIYFGDVYSNGLTHTPRYVKGSPGYVVDLTQVFQTDQMVNKSLKQQSNENYCGDYGNCCSVNVGCADPWADDISGWGICDGSQYPGSPDSYASGNDCIGTDVYWPNTDEGISDGTNAAPNEFSGNTFPLAYSFPGQQVPNCRSCCSYLDADCGMVEDDYGGMMYNESACTSKCCSGCLPGYGGSYGGNYGGGYDDFVDPYTDITSPEYASLRYGLPAGFYVECSVTLAEAIAMFTAYQDQHDPCLFTKVNGPFTCESAAPLGVAQRFSLAYANALLAYTAVSAMIINIFFGKAKRVAEGKDRSSKDDTDVEKEFVEVSGDDRVRNLELKNKNLEDKLDKLAKLVEAGNK